MPYTKRELEAKAKRELQQIVREIGAIPPGDLRKRAIWIDAILAAQGGGKETTVQGPEVKAQEFKPTQVAQPLPIITVTQTYPRPKREPQHD